MLFALQLVGIAGDAAQLRRRGEMLGQHLDQHAARGIGIGVDQEHEAALAQRQQHHRRVHARQGAGVRHRHLSVDVGDAPAVAITVEQRTVPFATALGNRHGRVGGPFFVPLLGRQPIELLRRRREPIHGPGQHIVQTATYAAGRIHRRRLDDRPFARFERVAAVAPDIRVRDIADLLAIPRADLTALHAERLEYLAAQQRRIRRAAGRRRNLAGNDVQSVVVGVTRAKTVGRLEVLQAGDHIVGREAVRRRPQHQVAGAFGQAAAMHEQIADLHIRGDPRIVHAERRQEFRHRIVPTQLALLHQPRQQRGGHGLGVRGDLEQGLRIHRFARGEIPERARVDHLAVVDNADGHAGQVIARDHSVDHAVVVGARIRVGRGGRRSAHAKREHSSTKDGLGEMAHATSHSCARCSPACISSKVCRRRTAA